MYYTTHKISVFPELCACGGQNLSGSTVIRALPTHTDSQALHAAIFIVILCHTYHCLLLESIRVYFRLSDPLGLGGAQSLEKRR